MTISPFFKFLPTVSLDNSNGDKSGLLNSSIGVGTVTKKILHLAMSLESKVSYNLFAELSLFVENSNVLSKPFFSSLILFLSISKPIVEYFLLNLTVFKEFWMSVKYFCGV